MNETNRVFYAEQTASLKLVYMTFRLSFSPLPLLRKFCTQNKLFQEGDDCLQKGAFKGMTSIHRRYQTYWSFRPVELAFSRPFANIPLDYSFKQSHCRPCIHTGVWFALNITWLLVCSYGLVRLMKFLALKADGTMSLLVMVTMSTVYKWIEIHHIFFYYDFANCKQICIAHKFLCYLSA